MDLTHWMHAEPAAADAYLLTCPEPGCGRRVILTRDAHVEVLDAGDFYSRHIASVGPIVLAAEPAA